MSLKFKLFVGIALIMVCYTQAGVLRGEDNAKDLIEITTLALETSKDVIQATTPRDLLKNVPIAIALTRDEYASIKIMADSEDTASTTTATLDDEERATTPENLFKDIPLAIAFSKDEDASIKIAEASVDPAPGTVKEDTEVLNFATAENENSAAPQVQKSAKLLLLSAPKHNEKPKEPEEYIEEPEDIDDAGAEATTTTELVETTTIAAQSVEENDEDTIDPTTLVTKLFAINDTLSADYTKASSNSVQSAHTENAPISAESENSEDSTDMPDVVPGEQAAAPKSDSIGSALLIETEADYVLLDADVEQFGSFTHENSAVHLQPIVQSVEIVPTHVDDPYIVNYEYVHHDW